MFLRYHKLLSQKTYNFILKECIRDFFLKSKGIFHLPFKRKVLIKFAFEEVKVILLMFCVLKGKTVGVLVFFSSVAMRTCLWQTQFKGCISAHSSRVQYTLAGVSRLQEIEVADYITLQKKKKEIINVCAQLTSPFYILQGTTYNGWVFPP